VNVVDWFCDNALYKSLFVIVSVILREILHEYDVGWCVRLPSGRKEQSLTNSWRIPFYPCWDTHRHSLKSLQSFLTTAHLHSGNYCIRWHFFAYT